MGEYNDITRRVAKAPEPPKPRYRPCSVDGCGNYADIITDTNCLCGQHYQIAIDRRGLSANILAVKASGDPAKREAMKYIYQRFQTHPIWDNTRYHRAKNNDLG